VQEAELIHKMCEDHRGVGVEEYVTQVYGYAEGPMEEDDRKAFNVAPDDDAFCIVMALAEGGTLDSLLYPKDVATKRPLTLHDKMTILAKVASAVAMLHGVGCVHGDLKPENILFGNESYSSVKIADFGLSKLNTAAKATEKTWKNSTMRKTGTTKVRRASHLFWIPLTTIDNH